MKALALLSGGLDSTLAIKLVQQQGIEVEAINFTSPFCLCSSAQAGCSAASLAAQKLQVKLHYQNCGEAYLRLVERPPHGYGKHMNPCLDCRIYKFQLAQAKMVEIGADFLVSGEVLDQRPNSQRRDALAIVERDSGLRGYILRPLCAKHLPPTIPEERGWIDRQQLLAIKGRGRREQMNLAADYGIADYPCPAGGCLLTYEEYSCKIKDLLDWEGRLTLRAIGLLRLGRHLRLSPEVKLVVGKDQTENQILHQQASAADTILELVDLPGPTSLYLGPPQTALLKLAAAITAGYGSGPLPETTRVTLTQAGQSQELSLRPLDRLASRSYFIYPVS